MKKRLLTIITGLFLLIHLPISAQNMDYARTVVDTLCSEYMSGRGYTNEGDKKAANFIKAEFKRLGLLAFEDDYFQSFPINVQTFSGKMAVAVNGKNLVVGKDFIVHPASKGLKANFKGRHLKSISIKDLKNPKKWTKITSGKYKNKVLILPKLERKEKELTAQLQALKEGNNAKLYLTYEPKKLTWHISQEAANYTEIKVLNQNNTEVLKRLSVDVESDYLTNYTTQNVIGYIKGTEQPDSFYVFTAHYDHIGQMGATEYVAGANDNASGTAMLLNLAEYYSQHPPKYSMVFIAFGGEELGLLGSFHFAANPLIPLANIKFLVNMDIVGTGDEGITMVNATEVERAFKTFTQINEKHQYLPSIKKRKAAANSDHHPFAERGVPAVFIYTRGGIQAYHDIYDRAETLPLTEFLDIVRLIVGFVGEY